jgi:hypothetical protein
MQEHNFTSMKYMTGRGFVAVNVCVCVCVYVCDIARRANVAYTHARKEDVIPWDCLILPFVLLGFRSYVIWLLL